MLAANKHTISSVTRDASACSLVADGTNKLYHCCNLATYSTYNMI